LKIRIVKQAEFSQGLTRFFNRDAKKAQGWQQNYLWK